MPDTLGGEMEQLRTVVDAGDRRSLGFGRKTFGLLRCRSGPCASQNGDTSPCLCCALHDETPSHSGGKPMLAGIPRGAQSHPATSNRAIPRPTRQENLAETVWVLGRNSF